MLNPVSAWALFGALTGLFAALSVAPLGRVPEWEDLRPLKWVALTAALMSAADITDTLTLPPAVHVWSNRLQVLAIALHILAWIVYLPGWAKRPERPVRWAWPLAVLGLLALVPGLVYGEGTRAHPLPWLGVVYHDPILTPAGQVVWVAIGAYGIWGLYRTAAWGRSGAPYPLAHLAALGVFAVVILHDAAVETGLPLPTPYLLGVGTFSMMVVFGIITLRRISEQGIQYHRLRTSLESAVADRSRQLEDSQAALARAERLAAVGQFSAGVAHEVKVPAASVASRLSFLAGACGADPRPEVRQAVAEARSGVARIEALARQLLLAGGNDAGGKTLEAIRVADALRPALAVTRARAEGRATLSVEVPDELWVLGHHESLVQALTNLLVNAVQAIPAVRSGAVTVRAAALCERVQLVVQDDGVGMSDEELRHVFEPFHAAKAPGQGTGLGLAVARTLLDAMQGSLRFESAVGRGTQAIVELARTEPRAPAQPATTPAPSAAARASLLVVDDDPDVLRSMARLLGRQHQVRIAAGVREALAAIEEDDFDLVICDVMMPDGGGERFWAELLLRKPALMNRVAFMTGGAVTGEARAFLRRPPRPVLIKPFEVMVVNELLAELPRAAARGPDAAEPRPSTLAKLKR